MHTDSNTSRSIEPQALYRASECARFYSIGLSTWWHWTKSGKAPKGIKLSPKVTVWEGSKLLKLKQELIAEAESQEGRV